MARLFFFFFYSVVCSFLQLWLVLFSVLVSFSVIFLIFHSFSFLFHFLFDHFSICFPLFSWCFPGFFCGSFCCYVYYEVRRNTFFFGPACTAQVTKAWPAPRASMLTFCIYFVPQAQHSTQSAVHKTAKQARADQSAATQGNGQEGESQHVVENLYLARFFSDYFFCGPLFNARGTWQVRTRLFLHQLLLLNAQKSTPSSYVRRASMLSSIYFKHSTAPCMKEQSTSVRTYVRADQSATMQPSRQSWWEPHHVVRHIPGIILM